MAVQIDEAGQHVVAGELQNLVVRPGLGPALGIDRHARKAHAADRRDPVALDHDVDRAARRRAGAVDEADSAQDQALERPFTLGPRRGLGGLILRGGAQRQDPEYDDHERAAKGSGHLQHGIDLPSVILD